VEAKLGLLDYIEGREKNQLSKLFLTHAFHVGFDRFYDLFPVLVGKNKMSVERFQAVRFIYYLR
jgi:hypothetical protein